ncbi:MAG: alpha/beta hydrolase [Actinomycetota bacterium]
MAAHTTKSRIAELPVATWEPSAPAKGSVLLLHGLWVGGWVWEPFAELLAAAGFASHAPTMRGHYDSRPVADVGNLSYFDYVQDALAVSRALKPAAVVGHSGGGLTAQKLAEAEPSLRALVLMNSAPPRGIIVRPTWAILRAQFKYLTRILGKQPVLPEEDDYLQLFVNTGPEEVRRAFYQRICPDSGRALREILLGRVAVDAERVRCPVYVLGTGLDPTLGPKTQRKIARKYGARYVEHPDLGHHWFIQEGWERAASEVVTWLDDTLGRSG